MATPRKHWFRVADSVLNESWSNNELAALIRLMAYLNTRWARSGLDPDEACEAEIPIAAVMQITGRGRADVARSSLEHLADLTGMSVGGSSKVCSIKWPKWAEFQELRPRNCPRVSRESPPPQTHPQTHPQEEKEPSASRSPMGGSPRVQKGRKAMPPSLPDRDRERLLAWSEKNRFTPAQAKYATEHVRDWAYENDKRKADWVRTIQNGMRDGWALKGYQPPTSEPDVKQSDNWDLPESDRQTEPIAIERYRDQRRL